MHAADKNINCMQQHKSRGQKSARPSKLETARSHNKTEHGAWVSEPRHETATQDMSAGVFNYYYPSRLNCYMIA